MKKVIFLLFQITAILCYGQSGSTAYTSDIFDPHKPGINSPSDWINYGSVYYKIGVARDGIFRITPAFLRQNGADLSGIDPRTIKLFESGKEQSVFVMGQDDGVFDNHDYIEFYGSLHYSRISARTINADGLPYNNYLDKYTDTSYYFLTWSPGAGKRMQQQNAYVENVRDTLNYYTSFSHIEQNNVYQSGSTQIVRNQHTEWLETEAWYWNWQGVGTLNFSFSVTDLILSRNAGVYYKGLSIGSSTFANAHNLVLRINNTKIDSQSINKNARLLLGKTFNSALLKEGTNTLSVQNIDNGTNPNILIYDWYEFEYPRKLKAVNDSISFQIRDSINTGLKVIRVDNVASDSLAVYRVAPEPKRINNVRIQNSSAFFTDTVGPGFSYVMIRKDRIPSPVFIYKKQFLNLSDSKRKAEYIAITHRSLESAAKEYTAFVKNHYNVAEQLVFIDDIFDEYSYGYPEPESIKEFLRTANKNWSAPKPSFLTILGSANYDYKDYTYLNKKIRMNKNLVPSFGEPVSDSWFVVWDSTFIPRMMVGRIPANTPEELRIYLDKHKAYVSQTYNEFNKSGMFFSGGDGNNQSELDDLRRVNNTIINESALPRPAAVNSFHFYKTGNPVSDFGPYPYKFVDSVIKAGTLFVSYIGHSATRTWDNSIAEPEQLNNTAGRTFLVTDFGCSTNKFAEPDVASFSSLFLFKGQAIAYIGNTSLGFMSTTATVPQLFYRNVLKDSVITIGKAHLNSKTEMFKKYGNTEINQIFSLTNSLAGDPIIKLAVPQKPNLKIESANITVIGGPATDQDDSLKISVSVYNHGSSPADSFSVLLTDRFENKTHFERKVRRLIPLFKETFIIAIPVNKKTGVHQISVSLDPENHFNEIDENDNSAEINANVFSLSLRPYSYDQYLAVYNKNIRFLNPSAQSSKSASQIIVQTDSTAGFRTPKTNTLNLGTFYTDFDLTGLPRNKRLWLRTRSDENSSWTKEFSFLVSDSSFSKIEINDQPGFEKQQMSSLTYKNNSIQLNNENILLNVKSGGGDVSKYGSVNINGINILPNTFSWGMGIAVIDEKTMHVDTARTFWTGDNPPESAALANLINNIPAGKLVVMNAIDDASSGLTSQLKTAIKTLGSTKVDSISFRGPWLLIGKKGAAPGRVIEIVKDRTFLNILSADTSFYVLSDKGKLVTSFFGPAGKWKNIALKTPLPLKPGSLGFKLIGQKRNYSIDTIQTLEFNSSNISSIENVDASVYPFIKLEGTFRRDETLTSAQLNSIRLEFAGTPELGINYQTVSVPNDSVQRGDDLIAGFTVFNAGETRADSIKIQVEVVKEDNSREVIFNSIADSVSAGGKKEFQIKFNTGKNHGRRNLLINIDPDNKISELIKDNNYYSVPFYIRPDTTIPVVKTTFDGTEIMDGDYVSVDPEIRIELSDNSFLPVNDTSSISIRLNNKPVWYSSTPELKINYSGSNPKAVAVYKPHLKNGEYRLKITARNTAGNYADIPDSIITFIVSDQLKIMDLFNYPNPFRHDTYFTFKLPQVPDLLKIKIYTVAGRLIRNLEMRQSELKYDFNKIYWDGRDQDGDMLANGTYLYKVILEKDGKSESYIRKLSIVR